MKKYGLFTFFTGAGFLDLGFESAGFTSLFANEIFPEFCEVYRHSRKKMNIAEPKYGLQELDVNSYLTSDKEKEYLSTSLKSAKKEFDLVGFIGGPPCPDFSVAGNNKGSEGKHGKLSQTYMDLICRELPDFFVFENVKGLWRTAKHRAFFDKIVKQAQDAGYCTTARLINALEYGAPQDRDRIILIGVLKKHLNTTNDTIDNFNWDSHILHSMDDIKRIGWSKRDSFVEDSVLPSPVGIIEELTVEHWFRKNDVYNHPNSNNFFIPRAGLIKMQTYDEGDDSKKCYKRLHRWRYSPTAAYGNNEVHLHPYKARRLSVSEALAIQSLPKEFELPQSISLSAMFKTIGNGVPFVAAQGVAKTLKDFLDSEVK
jgi:DNA (cytosine-5)-methyltransferase 1